MPGPIVDIHPHIVSPDTKRYPLTPLFGIQSDWSKERTASDEQLVAEMDEARRRPIASSLEGVTVTRQL